VGGAVSSCEAGYVVGFSKFFKKVGFLGETPKKFGRTFFDRNGKITKIIFVLESRVTHAKKNWAKIFLP
jgi:hypothetical protein